MLDKIPAAALGGVLGLVFFVSIHVVTGRPLRHDPVAAAAAAQPVVEEAPPADTPESLYTTNCGACHQAEGEGMPGLFPALAASEWVVEDPETPIRVLICGIQGDIDVGGASFSGVMPALANLTDAQIAMIVTHIRTSWGNDAGEVDEATVAAVRASIGDRSTPISGGAELAAMRDE